MLIKDLISEPYLSPRDIIYEIRKIAILNLVSYNLKTYYLSDIIAVFSDLKRRGFGNPNSSKSDGMITTLIRIGAFTIRN